MGWYPCCCEEDEEPVECTKCETDTTPYQISISVPALDNSTCNDCASFAGTYVVTQVSGDSCTWYGTFTNPTTCAPTFIIGFLVSIGDDPDLLTTGRVLRVDMNIFPPPSGTPTTIAIWRNWYVDDYTDIDCQFSNLEVEAYANGTCNVTGDPISVHLTAV